jgi:predicted nucleotidyltransferase
MFFLNIPKSGDNMPNMSILPRMPISTTRTSLADALFSATQQRVLGLLFGQSERSFYATELIGLVGGGSGGVQRELARLVQSGLVTVRRIGSQKHYQANPDSPIYEELCSIAFKTIGLAEPLRKVLAPLAPKIHAAFVYGSVAKRQDTASSDIDLMVVSDSLSYADVFGALEEVGNQLGRPVNPTVYTRQEIAKRIQEGNAFMTRVLAQPKLWLIGEEHDLTA